MARKTTTRNPAGTGSIRKKTVLRNGKEYTCWEGRYTEGYDPGTGKQIQRSVTGKTQREVSQKLKAITHELDTGAYIAPSKLTVGEWLDIWTQDYLGGVKPYTVAAYEKQIRVHIRPALGNIKLQELNPHTIQRFYNGLGKPTAERPALSPKTVKSIHGVLHKAMKQTVSVGYIRVNPADNCALPRMQRKAVQPLDEEQTKKFLQAIQGHRFERLYTFTLFTGLREGEVLGLTWEKVNLKDGILLIDQQLQVEPHKGGKNLLVPVKTGKGRTIVMAPWVVDILKAQRTAQLEARLLAGPAWEDSGLVFTNELGGHLVDNTVYKNFKKIVASIGMPDVRFHDLRHSYAVAAIRAGDDIKTVQGNLGHATAVFTLDVYGHVTEQMKQASASRMESYIKQVLEL